MPEPTDYDRLSPYQKWLFDRRHPPGVADEPVVITDGPDHPLGYLLRLARERARAEPRRDRAVPVGEARCAALVVRRKTGGKARCKNRARPGGYCGNHRHLLYPE